jgi:PAS domain S-box-containing protein
MSSQDATRRDREPRRSSPEASTHTPVLPPAVIYLDDRLHCRLLNAACHQWFGASGANSTGSPLRDVVGAAPYDVLRRAVQASLEQGISSAVDQDLVLAGAGRRDVHVTCSFDATSVPGAKVVVVLVDIADRQRAAIQQSRRLSLLEDFLENGSEGLHWVAPDGKILWTNKAELELLGYTRDEYVGHHIAEFHVDQPIIEDILARLSCRETLQSYEARLRAKDGSIKHVLINSSVYWEGDSFIHTRCFTRDITHRRAAEAEREKLLGQERAAREEAERANRLKDEFLTTLSHELRTPLNAIVGWTHILQAGPDEPTLQRAIQVIHRNAMNQSQLIADILDTQRLAAGKLRLSLQEVDPAKVIESAIESVRPMAITKEIEISAVLDTETGPIVGDPDRLQQILWNLLSNAVKFTPKQGRVRVSLLRINSHVEVAVEDNGPGIDAEFLPYVFQRFRQGDSSSTRRHGGLGLGLAIVRDLVELHGGKVAAANRSTGQGAIFSVTLPRPSARPALPVVTSERRHHSLEQPMWLDTAPSLRDLRVLVVDDEADARELLAEVLSRCGADVVVASSAEEALSKVRESRPDVLVSDIEMPGQNGYDLIRAVRALGREEGGAVPAAALTAYAGAEDRMKALSAGFQIHLPKPVQPAELATVIASLRTRMA